MGPRSAGALVCAAVLGVAVMAGNEGCVTRRESPRSENSPSETSRSEDPAEETRLTPTLRTVSLEEVKGFAGSAKCAECHKKEAIQRSTNHARTLRPVSHPDQAEAFKNAAGYTNPTTGVSYRPLIKDGKRLMRVKAGKAQEDIDPEWVFGAGHRGFTYVHTFEDEGFELHASFYTREGVWDVTPGQQDPGVAVSPIGRPLDPQEHQRCFQCHSTAVVKDAGKLDLKNSLFGVTCKTCHGAGKAHAEAAQRGEADLKIAGYKGHQAQVSKELCGKCHRANSKMPAAEIERQLPRFQGAALERSACFQKSVGRLSCLTCHDPHRNAAETTRADYNRICMSCHTPKQPKQVACSVRPKGDCVPCHMPEQGIAMPQEPKFRTHWIKAWLNSEPPKVKAHGGDPSKRK